MRTRSSWGRRPPGECPRTIVTKTREGGVSCSLPGWRVGDAGGYQRRPGSRWRPAYALAAPSPPLLRADVPDNVPESRIRRDVGSRVSACPSQSGVPEKAVIWWLCRAAGGGRAAMGVRDRAPGVARLGGRRGVVAWITKTMSSRAWRTRSLRCVVRSAWPRRPVKDSRFDSDRAGGAGVRRRGDPHPRRGGRCADLGADAGRQARAGACDYAADQGDVAAGDPDTGQDAQIADTSQGETGRAAP